MTVIRRNLLKRIAKESGADLRRLVRMFKGQSAVQIAEKCYG